MRRSPTKVSLEYLTISGKILASALSRAKNISFSGSLPLNIDREIECFILSCGAVPSFKGFNGYPNSSCISINSQVVHGIPNNLPLMDGDLVTIDIGVSYMGNHTDAARTFVVGNKISNIQKKLIWTAKKALDDGINKSLSGNTVGDISYAVQRIIEFNNFKTPIEIGGHGIGLTPHENPFIPNYGVSGTGVSIVPGMCFAIEPIVMDSSNKIVLEQDGWTISSRDGTLSSHEEDTLYVTEDTPIILTRETLEGGSI